MTVRVKSMIERCMERFRRGDCATCESRQTCPTARWQQAFAFGAAASPAGAAPAPRSASAAFPAPFQAFIADLAGALQRHFPPRRKPSPFRQAVERHLEPLIGGSDVGVDSVARALGLSRQTLYRRLKAEGTTFEQVLDGLRHRLALEHLRQGLGVKQTAWRLGFSDPAAFSRAFKRWTGRSPSDIRPRTGG
jgi:AraC-like DNA-binding protein